MAEHDTLAALAVQIDELRAKVADMEQKGPGLVLLLAAEVKKLSAALNKALGKNKTLVTQAPYWPAQSGRERNDELTVLRDWVNGFLRPQYPGYPIPDCWPAHNEAVFELANLFAEWTRVYGDEENRPLDGALWFHERWMPGVRSRLFGPSGSVRCSQGSCVLQHARERAYGRSPHTGI
jgi:hypothetical protein